MIDPLGDDLRGPAIAAPADMANNWSRLQPGHVGTGVDGLPLRDRHLPEGAVVLEEFGRVIHAVRLRAAPGSARASGLLPPLHVEEVAAVDHDAGPHPVGEQVGVEVDELCPLGEHARTASARSQSSSTVTA